MGHTKRLFEDMRNKIADDIISYDEGDISILPVLTFLESYRTELEIGLKMIKEFKSMNIEQIDAAAKEYKNEFGGYRIEVRSGGKMYDFKDLDEWVKANKAMKDIEVKYKNVIASAEKGILSVDEFGEVLEAPKVSFRKGSILIKKIK